MSSISYQPHIDGLRALAVISVFIFHLQGSYLPGGFLGVDIFFVISGYLITSIIYKQKLQNQFSFKTFYIRRCKRILPPLFLVLLFTFVIGYKLLLPYDFYKLAISMISVVTFSANIQYSLRSGDYFSGDSSEWPLLHTWSLAVEEQYYFIFPILLFFLMASFPKRLNLILIAVSVLSFAIAEYMSRTAGLQSYSYYLIITRMGELLVGSLLALLQAQGRIKRTNNSLLTAFALSGVLLLFFLVNEHATFPGFIALFLCLFTGILINSKSQISRIVFENKLVIFFGLISYSLYLFHWPVLAFARYILNIESDKIPLPIIVQISCVAVVFLLSIFSYYLIEQPLRRTTSNGKETAVFYFVIPSLVVLGLSTVSISTNGYPERLDNSSVKAKYQFNHIDKERCPSLVQLGCIGGNPDSSSVVMLYGNSHAEHYFDFIADVSQAFGYKTYLFAKGGCSLTSLGYSCGTVRKHFLETLEVEQAEVVVLAFRWDIETRKDHALSALKHLIEQSLMKSNRVVVLAQPPLLTVNPAKIANCARLELDCIQDVRFSKKYPTYNQIVRKAVIDVGGEFLDPFDYVEDRKMYTQDGMYYYYDRDHLSLYGNKWLSKNYLLKNNFEFLK